MAALTDVPFKVIATDKTKHLLRFFGVILQVIFSAIGRKSCERMLHYWDFNLANMKISSSLHTQQIECLSTENT